MTMALNASETSLFTSRLHKTAPYKVCSIESAHSYYFLCHSLLLLTRLTPPGAGGLLPCFRSAHPPVGNYWAGRRRHPKIRTYHLLSHPPVPQAAPEPTAIPSTEGSLNRFRLSGLSCQPVVSFSNPFGYLKRLTWPYYVHCSVSGGWQACWFGSLRLAYS